MCLRIEQNQKYRTRIRLDLVGLEPPKKVVCFLLVPALSQTSKLVPCLLSPSYFFFPDLLLYTATLHLYIYLETGNKATA